MINARDNLCFFAALYSLAGVKARRAIDEVLTLVALSDRAGDKVGTFSGGMKRRLNLAAALRHISARVSCVTLGMSDSCSPGFSKLRHEEQDARQALFAGV